MTNDSIRFKCKFCAGWIRAHRFALVYHAVCSRFKLQLLLRKQLKDATVWEGQRSVDAPEVCFALLLLRISLAGSDNPVLSVVFPLVAAGELRGVWILNVLHQLVVVLSIRSCRIGSLRIVWVIVVEPVV